MLALMYSATVLGSGYQVIQTIMLSSTCGVGSAQCSGCVVYGPGAMAAI